ncbi:sterol desaturase family protein [soil metagenome]
MQTFTLVLTHLAGVVIFLLLYYFIPVISFYYLLFVRNKRKWKHLKIQQKYPESKQLKREIKYSLTSLAIFSLAGLFIYEVSMSGYSLMYFNISDYGTMYFVFSLIITIFVNDTFYYWTHRLMHLKGVFNRVHLVHHKSTTPNPFSMFAFHPWEACIHAINYILLTFLIPIHPVMFFAFHFYNLVTNLAGHCGFEFMPAKLTKHWFFNWQNTVTNHDAHHKNFDCHYGNYFLFWDKWMHTIEHQKTGSHPKASSHTFDRIRMEEKDL